MIPNTTTQAVPPMVEDAVTGSGARRIFVRRYDNDNADYVLVLVHGTAGNSEGYDAFAEHMWLLGRDSSGPETMPASYGGTALVFGVGARWTPGTRPGTRTR